MRNYNACFKMILSQYCVISGVEIWGGGQKHGIWGAWPSLALSELARDSAGKLMIFLTFMVRKIIKLVYIAKTISVKLVLSILTYLFAPTSS